MNISELIKYEGDNSTFVWKCPSEDFNSMTELIVNENQEAIFFSHDQIADTFGPGRYKLEAKNIPILTKILNQNTGEDIFHCEVYFIDKTVQMEIKWETNPYVRFVEPTYEIPIEIGASGEISLAVSDGRTLLIHLLRSMRGIDWDDEGAGLTTSLQSTFRLLISIAVKANLSAAIKQRNIYIVEVNEHLSELSEFLKGEILPGFEEYGLTIPSFSIANIVLSERDITYLKELQQKVDNGDMHS